MKTRHPEAGMAMMTALVTLLLVTVIGLSLTAFGMLSVTVADNDRETNEALAIADAGMTHAKALLLNQVWIAPALPPGAGAYDQLLEAGNGTACDGDEFSVKPSNASQPYPDPPDLIPGAGRPFPAGNTFGGRYFTFLCDDHTVEGTLAPPDVDPKHDENGRVIARSRGVGRNGAEATLEAVFEARPLPALLVDGNLRINGNPTIKGLAGGVHANGNMDLKGTSMCVELYYASVGNITGEGDGGPACTAEDSEQLPGSYPLPVPKLDPNEPLYRDIADYLLISATKQVKCGKANTTAACIGSDPLNPTILATLPNNGTKWNDWGYHNDEWTANGANVPEGTYWTDGNVNIGSTGGSVKKITIFSLGWVNISGNAKLGPDNAIGGLLYAVVAGTDLEISGTLGTDWYEGLYYARDQINFVGTPDIRGHVVARNIADGKWPLTGGTNLVPLGADGFVEVSGNVNITYNGGSGWSALHIASWRECRGADANNPCGNP